MIDQTTTTTLEGETAMSDERTTKRQPPRKVVAGSQEARELSQAGVRARQERARERQAATQEAALTVPQRITIAWAAEVTVADIQGLIRRCIDKGDTAGLTRIYEMGYGKTKPSEADEDPDPEANLADLTSAQRAARRAMVMRELARMEAAASQDDGEGGRSDGA